MKLTDLRAGALALGLLALAGCSATSPVEQQMMIDAGQLRWEVSDAPTHDFRVYLRRTADSEARAGREAIVRALLSAECTQVAIVRERTVALQPALGRPQAMFVLDIDCERG